MKLNKEKCRGAQGWMLIEVMVAIIIFAIMAVGGMMSFSYGRSQINNAGNNRIASELGRAQIEQCRANAYTNIVTVTDNNLAVGDLLAQRVTTVAETIGASGTYKQITVHVQWPQNTPKYHVWMYTIIAKP